MSARNVIELFILAAEARSAERKAFSEYGGYSWGYFGADLIEAADKREQEASDALDALIHARIIAFATTEEA